MTLAYDDAPPIDGTEAQADGAETAVIGVILAEPKRIDDVADLDPADFYHPRREALWRLILKLHAEGYVPDVHTVAAQLGKIPEVQLRPDHTTLIDYVHHAPIGVTVTNYARLVAEAATNRRIKAACHRGMILASDAGADPATVQDMVLAEVTAASGASSTAAVLVDDALDAYLEHVEHGRDAPATPTPWPSIDDRILGTRPGGLYVIGARPSVGKTLVCLQWALELARHGYVAYHTLEMAREEVLLRALSNLSSVPQRLIERRDLSQDQWTRLRAARRDLGARTLSIDDRAGARVADIRSHARALQRKGPLAAVVVDYLGLLGTDRSSRESNRQQEVAANSRALKILARDLKVPVILAAQLNRGPEQRTDRRPVTSDLRESGAVEQDADVVMLLHVEDDVDHPEDLDILIGKNRQGPKGIVRLVRNGHIARIDEPGWANR